MDDNKIHVMELRHLDRSQRSLAGGKAANLGELSRMEAIQVPPGICITTHVFDSVVLHAPLVGSLVQRLSQDTTGSPEIADQAAALRQAIEDIQIPIELQEKILHHLSVAEIQGPFAVRSSATTEDLPDASFAGQQDSFLNIRGFDNLFAHIKKCWASLYTERAVRYRRQQGFHGNEPRLAVIIQKMINPDASGVMFTADPLTSNRKVISIDAGFGLGADLVSGRAHVDTYTVFNQTIRDKRIFSTSLRPGQVLSDDQVLALAGWGRKIEKHFGSPQDIEWCLSDGSFYFVQSRPITTLYPVPQSQDSPVSAEKNRVYISVGHQQMMTDPILPLGLSIRDMTSHRSMSVAGGRMFADLTPMLSSPASRRSVLHLLEKSDPLIYDAITSLIARGDFLDPVPEEHSDGNPSSLRVDFDVLKEFEPGTSERLIKTSERAIEVLRQQIDSKSGAELLSFIAADLDQLKESLFTPENMGLIMTAMNASNWINQKMEEWLGEKSAADVLTLSVPDNITSEMGMALLDLADLIRPYPHLIAFLQTADNTFLEKLPSLEGGQKIKNAIRSFLEKYGMRCTGEIDITRPRWIEEPSTLLPALLSNVRNFKPGESGRKFQQGLEQAQTKEYELLSRLKDLSDGEIKVQETKRMIRLLRSYAGYREYPKYAIVSRYLVYKLALLREAGQLVDAAVLREKEDIFYLSFEELQHTVQTQSADLALIDKRKQEYRLYQKMKPPRVITSDGEVLNGRYHRGELPRGALVGLPVSAGVVEGRARIVQNIGEADLLEGDILVTTFTDPSWTALFVSVKGLVTEVGGLMTHGAVIAREYGLPAVVSVDQATSLIKDGQRIRVHGTEGYVELL